MFPLHVSFISDDIDVNYRQNIPGLNFYQVYWTSKVARRRNTRRRSKF